MIGWNLNHLIFVAENALTYILETIILQGGKYDIFYLFCSNCILFYFGRQRWVKRSLKVNVTYVIDSIIVKGLMIWFYVKSVWKRWKRRKWGRKNPITRIKKVIEMNRIRLPKLILIIILFIVLLILSFRSANINDKKDVKIIFLHPL